MEAKEMVVAWLKSRLREEDFDKFVYGIPKSGRVKLHNRRTDPELKQALDAFIRMGILQAKVHGDYTAYIRTGFNVATVTFDGEKYPEFHVLHNMPISDTHNSVSHAVDNWLARTDTFTDRSFKDYVEGKNAGYIVRLMRMGNDGNWEVV